jgi:2-polyprenyl-3-methyl-5-hydroxy-6-metoxy-1,4-benzoquinol methylase
VLVSAEPARRVPREERQHAPSPRAGERDAFERRWHERFSQYAEHHEDDASIAGWSATGLAARIRQFRRSFPAALDGERWLDAGCGAGTYSRYLASLGANVLGVDYSFRTVEKARSRGGREISFCVADATALPVRAESFDGALCLGVTQALSRSERLVAALAQIVRPGGQVWIDGLNAWCFVHVLSEAYRNVYGRPRHLRYETPRGIKRLLRAHGFTGLRVFWLPIVPSRLQRLQRLIEAPASRFLLRAVPPIGALFSHSFIVCGVKRRGTQGGVGLP